MCELKLNEDMRPFLTSLARKEKIGETSIMKCGMMHDVMQKKKDTFFEGLVKVIVDLIRNL